MKFVLACIGLAVLVAQGSATKFNDCGSKDAQVTKVEVTDCPDSDSLCVLKRGSKKDITIQFQSKSTSQTVKAVVHGVIGGVPLPFYLPKSDGCQSGLSCPLQNDQTYTYTNSLDIKNSYPPLGVTVRWELKGDSGSDLTCVEIACKIE